jgi:hypothetical protein
LLIEIARVMPSKPLQPQLDAVRDSESDSSDDGDFVPSGSGRCAAALSARLSRHIVVASWLVCPPLASDCIFSGSDSEAADSDISDGEVKKVSADAGDAVKLVAAAGHRATRASGD